MILEHSGGWPIDELAERAAEALAEGNPLGVPSARVRDVPSARTIRYYTTLGLLDRAAVMRGRTAYYGRRHLMQLVAIKRMQAAGLPLAAIQERLLGQPDSGLERLAAGPNRVKPLGAGGGTLHPGRSRSAAAGPAIEPVAVLLAESATLSLQAERPLTDRDRRLIRMAAAPLLELLRLNGLIGRGSSSSVPDS